MTESEWQKLLDSYTTSRQVADESLVGIIEHIDMKCNHWITPVITTWPPFHQELPICDRGTKGCNLVHNDKMALVFARMALERVQEIELGDDPMPEIDPITVERG